jgi:hypothetical protein
MSRHWRYYYFDYAILVYTKSKKRMVYIQKKFGEIDLISINFGIQNTQLKCITV